MVFRNSYNEDTQTYPENGNKKAQRGLSATKMTPFRDIVISLLRHLNATPSLLEKKHPAMMKILDDMKKAADAGDDDEIGGQGSANRAVPHEACFAVEAEKIGFKFLRPNVKPTDGYWFQYQVGGTQTKLDFRLLGVAGESTDHVDIDLKHSNGMDIKLNDGWFWEQTVYIISFTRKFRKVKKEPKKDAQNVCLIAHGPDVSTVERTAMRNAFVDAMNKLKAEFKGDGVYKPYPRKADGYSCKEFTDEFVKDRLEKTLAWLAPSPSPSAPAPHSPPA